MSAPPKLVLFDCDGTLVDSQHLIVAAMDAAHHRLGQVPPQRSAILKVVGLSLPEAFAVLGVGRAGYPAAALAAGYKDAFMALRQTEPPEPLYPGAHAVLTALNAREDVVLGIVTGKSRRGVDKLLEAQGMEGWFATIQTADTAPSKPHPAMVQMALAETGLATHDTVVIGDTSYDMAMARAAGVAAIGVSWGYHDTAALTAAGAHVLVREFAAVPQAIHDLLTPGAASDREARHA